MDKKIFTIINERQLVSVMNQTKWLRLVEGVGTLPFPPAFQMRVVTQSELLPPTFSEHITYLGDWQHLQIKTYDFANIEWLKIRPYFYRHVGQLVPDEKLTCRAELESLLMELHISYEIVGEDVLIKGYLS